ncbi:MAG: response regulator [bacterium]|nr:response regulator [bacterium]
MTNIENNKKRVLIVDDDENLRMVLTDKLTFSGFEVMGAVDGEDGLKKTLELHPDIILLDVTMPKMGGLEMLGELRKDDWGKNAKVIMLTSLEDVGHVAEAMEKRSFLYLVKSQLNLDDVVKQVNNTLGIK